jgi:hypothetical protein
MGRQNAGRPVYPPVTPPVIPPVDFCVGDGVVDTALALLQRKLDVSFVNQLAPLMLLLSYYFIFTSIQSNSNLIINMNSCVYVGGIIGSAFMKRFLKYLNFGAFDRNRNDCGDIEDFKIISLLSGDATMYDLINNEESSLKYGIYLVALCNLIQEIEESLDLDDGEYVTFSLTPNTAAGSGGVFCDSPLAFAFGLYSIQIQLICDDQLYGFIPTFRIPFH